MVIIDTVINTILGRLTLDPAGMHCPSWDDAFVSSLISDHYGMQNSVAASESVPRGRMGTMGAMVLRCLWLRGRRLFPLTNFVVSGQTVCGISKGSQKLGSLWPVPLLCGAWIYP